MPTSLAPPSGRVEYKVLTLSRKAAETAATIGEFEAYASTYDLDQGGDRVVPGAFSASLQRRAHRPLLWAHDHSQVVGVEVSIGEDSRGLRGRWKFADTAQGRDARTLVKAGAVTSMSIGYVPVTTREAADGARELVELNLFECSLVSLPMNEAAQILSAKQFGGPDMSALAARLAQRGVMPLPVNRHSGSLGQQLIASVEYKQLVGAESFSSENANVRARIELPSISLKTLATSLPTPGALAVDTQSGSDTLPLLIDLLPTIPTVENLVKVASQTTAPTAGTVAEATATSGSSGTKLETGLGWAEADRPVEVVATWVPATRALLSDAAGFQALADAELTYAVRLELERQVLTGNGVRPNLAGITGLTGTNAIAVGAAGALAAIADAIGAVRANGKREPNVIVMEASAWKALSAARENTASGTLGGHVVGAPGLMTDPPRLFGKVVIPSLGLAVGTAIVGATSTATIFERAGAAVVLGTIRDFFIRNMVAVRCELRATLGVTRPGAWSTISGLPTSS